MNTELYNASLVAARDCMGLRPGERVLIITDHPLRPIGHALWQAVKDLGNEVLLVEMLPRSTNGEEPPGEVAALMHAFDVVLCPTSRSLTHTDARRGASVRGVRIATLPGVTEEIMVRCMNADYHRIAERTQRLAGLMNAVDTIRVTAPAGTDIVLPVKGRAAHASTGLYHERGAWGNLPTGEAYLAPLEGRSHGVVVVDGSMASIGVVHQPIRIVVEDGLAADIDGGAQAKLLIDLLAPYGREGRNVAEFGIGTNDKARLSGPILEDEKVMGTIHVAFGDNKSMGGSVGVASHLDGLVKRPTVWFDDRLIMIEGSFTLEL
jgi:aminopeptidase